MPGNIMARLAENRRQAIFMKVEIQEIPGCPDTGTPVCPARHSPLPGAAHLCQPGVAFMANRWHRGGASGQVR